MNLQSLFLTIMVLLSEIQFAYAITSSDAPKKATIPAEKSLTLSAMFKPLTQNATLFGVSSLSYTFSGATADTINYIQLCNANSDCSTCNAPFTTITSGTPIPYSTGGTTYGVNPASIAAYFQQGGFSAGSYNIGLRVQSTHLNCPSSTAYCSSKIDKNSSLLCIGATYDGTSVTALTQSDNGMVDLGTSSTQYAYPSASGTNTVRQYTLNSANGTLATLVNSTTISTPYGVAFGTFNNVQYGYVANNGGNIKQCAFSGGTLSGCSTTKTLTTPRGIAITTPALNSIQYAYVPSGSTSSGHVYKCTIVSSTGAFNICTITPATGEPTWGPRAIGFATVSSQTYAYVPTSTGGIVYKCPITASTGELSACTATPSSGPLWTAPNGIAITTVGGTQYAYVADNTVPVIARCSINASGDLGSCTSLPVNGTATFTSISIATVNGSQYAYIVGGSNNIAVCPINAGTAAFGTCVSLTSSTTPVSPLNGTTPRGTSFAFV